MKNARMTFLVLLAAAPGFGRQEDLKQAPAVIDKPESRGVGKAVPATTLLASIKDFKALVVVFTGADCPVSRLYHPKLGRLEKEYAARSVKFALVPADSDPALAEALDARRTPECFLLDSARVLRYRGAIDDQYGIGYSRDEPTRKYLVDALEAVLAGKAPAVGATEAPGCAIERPFKSAPGAGGVPAYHRDVAPVFQRRCVECHRPGEIGPFSLLSYAKAKSSAARIKEAVTQRRMPPWHADPKYGAWENDRHLSDEEIRTISRWADAGAPEGDPKEAPPAKTWPESWVIGTPDAVYRLPRPEKVPAEGTIPYRYITVRTGLKEDRWVQAMEVRPSARGVVHHILVFVQYPFNRLREQPPIDGGLFNGYFAIMVPGERPTVYPEGMGKLLPAGASLIFQIHYTANGEAAEDQTAIGIIFAKEPAKEVVVTRGIINRRIRIPPGSANHREEASFEFKHDAKILSFLPHMHVRGKSFRYVAIHPDGKEEILLDIPKYDFNWQTCYRYREPKLVKAGTKIRCIAHFDNSKGNPANPDPTVEVRFGQQTWEEMLNGYMDFVKVVE